MTDIISSLPWKAALPGICVTLINMHGDADAFTQHTAQFPLTVAGREDAAQLLRMLELLPAAVRKYDELDAMVTDLATQLSLTRPATTELFQQLGNLLRSDCTEDDKLAQPVAYFVDMADFHGVLSRAQFQDIDGKGMVGFRQLSSVVAPEYFSAWE
jgi:hypothetical protein